MNLINNFLHKTLMHHEVGVYIINDMKVELFHLFHQLTTFFETKYWLYWSINLCDCNLYIIIIVFFRNLLLISYVLTANGCMMNYPMRTWEINFSSNGCSSTLNRPIKVYPAFNNYLYRAFLVFCNVSLFYL